MIKQIERNDSSFLAKENIHNDYDSCMLNGVVHVSLLDVDAHTHTRPLCFCIHIRFYTFLPTSNRYTQHNTNVIYWLKAMCVHFKVFCLKQTKKKNESGFGTA